MKNATEYARKFQTLLKRVKTTHRANDFPQRDPVAELIFGFLMWNAPRRSAESALQRIARSTVDHNDLRVSLNEEIAAILGDQYPMVQQRSARMREALQEVFAREHILSLDMLHQRSKKDVRAYLESLPGITPFVAAHTTLVAFEGHAVPVDDRLVESLLHEGVIDPEATVEQITAFLERHVRAEQALVTHAVMQAWADAGTRRASVVRAASARKTTRKKAGQS